MFSKHSHNYKKITYFVYEIIARKNLMNVWRQYFVYCVSRIINNLLYFEILHIKNKENLAGMNVGKAHFSNSGSNYM